MARDLVVTKPAMNGPDVTKVQERLRALGYVDNKSFCW